MTLERELPEEKPDPVVSLIVSALVLGTTWSLVPVVLQGERKP